MAGLGTILTVWAHPDDETYLAGGLMAAAAASGQRTVCVTATHATGPRAAELSAALGVLGVREHHALDHVDGYCQTADPAVESRRLADLISAVRPDTVVTFGADGFTGHPDHRAVSSWVTGAVASVGGVRLLHAATTPEKMTLFADVHETFSVFADGTPHVVPSSALALSLRLEGSALEQKVTALRSHASQTSHIIDAIGLQRYGAWVAEECFVAARGRV